MDYQRAGVQYPNPPRRVQELAAQQMASMLPPTIKQKMNTSPLTPPGVRSTTLKSQADIRGRVEKVRTAFLKVVLESRD